MNPMCKAHGSEQCKRWTLADIVDALPRSSELPSSTLVVVSIDQLPQVFEIMGHTCNFLWKISLVCLKPLGLEIPGSSTNLPFHEL